MSSVTSEQQMKKNLLSTSNLVPTNLSTSYEHCLLILHALITIRAFDNTIQTCFNAESNELNITTTVSKSLIYLKTVSKSEQKQVSQLVRFITSESWQKAEKESRKILSVVQPFNCYEFFELIKLTQEGMAESVRESI